MSNIRDIINGTQLPRFLNKPISIIGKVTDVQPDGLGFTLESTDKVNIPVETSQEINDPMTGCWVEVHGKSTGKGISSTKYTIFSNETFDCDGYNKLCKYLYCVPNLWETGSASDQDY